MKHEMSISHATQTYQVLYGEGMERKRESNLCHTVKTLTNIQIKRINFMGRDGKQSVHLYNRLCDPVYAGCTLVCAPISQSSG